MTPIKFLNLQKRAGVVAGMVSISEAKQML